MCRCFHCAHYKDHCNAGLGTVHPFCGSCHTNIMYDFEDFYCPKCKESTHYTLLIYDVFKDPIGCVKCVDCDKEKEQIFLYAKGFEYKRKQKQCEHCTSIQKN